MDPSPPCKEGGLPHPPYPGPLPATASTLILFQQQPVRLVFFPGIRDDVRCCVGGIGDAARSMVTLRNKSIARLDGGREGR